MRDRNYDLEPVEETPIPTPKTAVEQYVPPRHEALQSYEINIRFLSRGCVIKVGCREIPFEDVDAAFYEIRNYFLKPFETQEKWREILK